MVNRILQNRKNNEDHLEYNGKKYKIISCDCSNHGDFGPCYFYGNRLVEMIPDLADKVFKKLYTS